jgi:phosphogluconate dehydratase
MIGELLEAGLLHPDTQTVAGTGLAHYTKEPKLSNGSLSWEDGARETLNDKVLRPATDPFQHTGGLVELNGNLGRGVMKVSAVAPERHVIEAPAAIFHDQPSVREAFRAGRLNRDVVVVVRFQGPRANGMPELHALTPILAVLQDRGHKVALVTDGRMSGASGKVPSAIHLSPEALDGGLIAKLRDGDVVRVDATNGSIDVLTEGVADRPAATPDLTDNGWGVGRELFEIFRDRAGPATAGAASVV